MMNEPSDNTDPTEWQQLLLVRTADILDMDQDQIDLDTDLMATGRMDSVAIITLVTLLEDDLSVSVPIEAITPENFSSVRQILKLAGN